MRERWLLVGPPRVCENDTPRARFRIICAHSARPRPLRDGSVDVGRVGRTRLSPAAGRAARSCGARSAAAPRRRQGRRHSARPPRGPASRPGCSPGNRTRRAGCAGYVLHPGPAAPNERSRDAPRFRAPGWNLPAARGHERSPACAGRRHRRAGSRGGVRRAVPTDGPPAEAGEDRAVDPLGLGSVRAAVARAYRQRVANQEGAASGRRGRDRADRDSDAPHRRVAPAAGPYQLARDGTVRRPDRVRRPSLNWSAAPVPVA